jgi:D-3-phosphoglycerate dehydrogenase
MRIVIADQMEEEVVKGIGALGQVAYRPADLPAALKDADALIVRSATKVTGELVAGAPKLKLVIRGGVGLDNVDAESCRARGIRVLNTPGASSNAVAELALGLILGAARNIQKAHHQMKEGRWEKKALAGREIAGRTLGVIGYGRIGALLARKAHALGMKVLAFNPSPARKDEVAEFAGSLDELLGRADVISIHVPATPETAGMISRESIAKMKDGVIIVNTSRGEIMDEDALYDAVKSGKVGAAALDVFRTEPYQGKLLELENVLLTPHLGASTKEAQGRIGEEIVRLLKEEIRG